MDLRTHLSMCIQSQAAQAAQAEYLWCLCVCVHVPSSLDLSDLPSPGMDPLLQARPAQVAPEARVELPARGVPEPHRRLLHSGPSPAAPLRRAGPPNTALGLTQPHLLHHTQVPSAALRGPGTEAEHTV
eukprot:2170379-Pyramimonas_sp.AAC.2